MLCRLVPRASLPLASRRQGAAALGLLAALASARVAAAEPARPLQLRYQAPAGCPDAEAFLAEVRRRAPDARLAAPGEGAPLYRVSLHQEGDLMVGQLQVEGPAGDASVREVKGDSCSSAASALAFVAALSLESEAPARDTPPAPAGRPARLSAAFGAGAALTGAIAPGLSAGVEASAAISKNSDAPSVRLSGQYLASGEQQAGPGQASFRLLSVAVAGCPVSLSAGSLRFLPCVGYELGSLRAQGRGVDLPLSEARSWQALRLDARARWRPAGRWFVEASAGLVLPLTSRRFVFDSPRAEVFSVPRVAGAGAAGVGMHFP